jgi:hypothetical protein
MTALLSRLLTCMTFASAVEVVYRTTSKFAESIVGNHLSARSFAVDFLEALSVSTRISTATERSWSTWITVRDLDDLSALNW